MDIRILLLEHNKPFNQISTIKDMVDIGQAIVTTLTGLIGVVIGASISN